MTAIAWDGLQAVLKAQAVAVHPQEKAEAGALPAGLAESVEAREVAEPKGTAKSLPAAAIKPPKAVMLKWGATVAASFEDHYARYEATIAKVAKVYAEGGFKMMVLKGWGLSLNYPIPDHRPCGDVDIWLFGEWKAADKYLSGRGVKVDSTHHHHTVFHLGGVMFENHYDFLNVHAHRSNRVIEKRLQELARQGYETAEVGGETVYLPSPDFNALFLLRHAASHFAATQITLRHLLDWGTFVAKRGSDVDWDSLYVFCRQMNMHKFLECIDEICVSKLGFPREVFPVFGCDKALSERVFEDILEHGACCPDGSPSIEGFIPRTLYRFRRWRGNTWKHRIVYKEGLFSTFFVQVWSHLLKPSSLK